MVFCLWGCASPGPAVRDLEGNNIDPFAAQPGKAVVLIFISNDCPISNSYAPELNRLYERFRVRGAAFWLVHADPSETPAAIAAHARDYKLNVPELRDPRHDLVKLAKVAVTPSAAVFGPNRRLLYHGRIDDRFADLGQQRPEAQHHELMDVVAAVVEHRPVPVTVTQTVGCYIPEAQH
jgi:peroxiredoxin